MIKTAKTSRRFYDRDWGGLWNNRWRGSSLLAHCPQQPNRTRPLEVIRMVKSVILVHLECTHLLRENWDTFGPGFLFNRATKEEITEEDVAKVKHGNDFDLCRLWRPMLWWISTLVGLKTWMRNIWTASLTCSLMLASYMVYTGENKLKVNHAKQWPWQIVSGGLV